MFRKVALAAAAAASVGVIGTADASGPTVAQIKAEIAKHRDNFVLANTFSQNGLPPGHGWLNLQYGGGRWVSANGRLVTLESVKLDPRDPALSDVTETTINYAARTWSRTKSQRPTKLAHPGGHRPLLDNRAPSSGSSELSASTVDRPTTSAPRTFPTDPTSR